MSLDQYLDNLSRVLMNFQYIEEMLKFYIQDCDKIIQKSVKNSFHYSLQAKKIDKMPLGRLIDEFSRRTNRKDFVKALKKFNEIRNEVAHTGYLLTVGDQKDTDKLNVLSQRLAKIAKALKSCIKELMLEYSRVKNEPIDNAILDKF